MCELFLWKPHEIELWTLRYSSQMLWLPRGINHQTGQSVSALSPSQYKQMTPGHQLKGSRTNVTAHKWQTAVFLLLHGARCPFPAQSLAQH
jgi:hypothetical protein